MDNIWIILITIAVVLGIGLVLMFSSGPAPTGTAPDVLPPAPEQDNAVESPDELTAPQGTPVTVPGTNGEADGATIDADGSLQMNQ